jgi:hypothetical protein
MKQSFQPRKRVLSVSSLLALLTLISILFVPGSANSLPPQFTQHREKLHDVVSRQRLSPGLRQGKVLIRFSPNGRYLLLQDAAGIYVLSREPLQMIGYLEAPHNYPAVFTADSRSVRAVSRDLQIGTWPFVAAEPVQEKSVPVKDGCLSVALSPDAEKFACLFPHFSFVVTQVDTGATLFAAGPHDGPAPLFGFATPIDTDTPFANPIGYIMAESFDAIMAYGKNGPPIFFSPDSQHVVFRTLSDLGLCVDLPSKKLRKLPGSLQDHFAQMAAYSDDERVLMLGADKQKAPGFFSIADGTLTSILTFRADTAVPASDPRYLLLSDSGVPGKRLFDTKENRSIELSANIGIDIFDSEIALFKENGDLVLYKLGDAQPLRTVHLPLAGLPDLRVASVSSDLSTFAFSFDSHGGVYSLKDHRLMTMEGKFLAGTLGPPPAMFLALPGHNDDPARIAAFDPASQKFVPQTSLGTQTLRSGGASLIEYSFLKSDRMRLPPNFRPGVTFRLRALDPANGHELWARNFTAETPIPFPDPQGTRLVLGWPAKSEAANQAARKNPVSKEIMKHAKVKEQDSFFEILDARSGKSLGGVLVQVASNAARFDFAFSEGDALILVKDLMRTSLYSLADGTLKARLVGSKPAASAAAKLLALDAGAGRLAIYDLETGQKLDDQLFPEDLEYLHFSSDGTQLFVFTKYQLAIVLDVSKIRQTLPVAPALTQP